jgi:hypothetical protein
VQSEKCLRLRASIGDGDGVITGFCDPCAADVLSTHFLFFSFHFNTLQYLEKLPSNFPSSGCCCDPAVDVFYLDELIAKRLRFALQIG